MQYIGERKVRLCRIGSYNLENGKDRFLSDKGMLLAYLLDDNYNDLSSVSGRYKGINYKYSDLSPEMKVEVRTVVRNKDVLNNGEVFEYNGKTYIKIKNKVYGGSINNSTIEVYEVLPGIYNDEVFYWNVNKKYNTKEAVITLGTFEFYCICDTENNIQVDVKYAKCDNRHRNRVTISTIKINDGDNQSIIDAINEWKNKFIQELKEIC